MEKNTKFHAGSTIVFLVEIKAEICSFVSRLAASKKRRPLCVNDYIALLLLFTQRRFRKEKKKGEEEEEEEEEEDEEEDQEAPEYRRSKKKKIYTLF